MDVYKIVTNFLFSFLNKKNEKLKLIKTEFKYFSTKLPISLFISQFK